MDLIARIWNNNLNIMDNLVKNNSELKYSEKLLELNRGEVEASLNNNQKLTFKRYCDCVNEYIDLSAEQVFL